MTEKETLKTFFVPSLCHGYVEKSKVEIFYTINNIILFEQ